VLKIGCSLFTEAHGSVLLLSEPLSTVSAFDGVTNVLELR